MSLSFPRITTPEFSTADYARWLKIRKPKTRLEFKSVLKHATIRHCSSASPRGKDEWQVDHTEIEDVFEWLKDRKVTTVLGLAVFGRLHCLHSMNLWRLASMDMG